MSTGAECRFTEKEPGEWHYQLQQWPYGANDEYEHYGPFSTFDQARTHLDRNHANPGGYSTQCHPASHAKNKATGAKECPACGEDWRKSSTIAQSHHHEDLHRYVRNVEDLAHQVANPRSPYAGFGKPTPPPPPPAAHSGPAVSHLRKAADYLRKGVQAHAKKYPDIGCADCVKASTKQESLEMDWEGCVTEAEASITEAFRLLEGDAMTLMNRVEFDPERPYSWVRREMTMWVPPPDVIEMSPQGWQPDLLGEAIEEACKSCGHYDEFHSNERTHCRTYGCECEKHVSEAQLSACGRCGHLPDDHMGGTGSCIACSGDVLDPNQRVTAYPPGQHGYHPNVLIGRCPEYAPPLRELAEGDVLQFPAKKPDEFGWGGRHPAEGVREILKPQLPKLSVKRGRGTSYMWTHIRGSGEGGDFSPEEKTVLQLHGLAPYGSIGMDSKDAKAFIARYGKRESVAVDAALSLFEDEADGEEKPAPYRHLKYGNFDPEATDMEVSAPVHEAKFRVTYNAHRYSDTSDPARHARKDFEAENEEEALNAAYVWRDSLHADPNDIRTGLTGRGKGHYVGLIHGAELVGPRCAGCGKPATSEVPTGRSNDPYKPTCGVCEAKDPFAGLTNLLGDLNPEVRERLRKVVTAPTDENWHDAHTIIISDRSSNAKMQPWHSPLGGSTLWQHVRAVDPLFDNVGPSSTYDPKTGKTTGRTPWKRVPDSVTLMRAIRNAQKKDEARGPIAREGPYGEPPDVPDPPLPTADAPEEELRDLVRRHLARGSGFRGPCPQCKTAGPGTRGHYLWTINGIKACGLCWKRSIGETITEEQQEPDEGQTNAAAGFPDGFAGDAEAAGEKSEAGTVSSDPKYNACPLFLDSFCRVDGRLCPFTNEDFRSCEKYHRGKIMRGPLMRIPPGEEDAERPADEMAGA